MIGVDAAIMLGLFIYKVFYHNPGIEYHHLIIDYHFGFAKRALAGTLVSFVVPVVPVWFVYVLGGAVWLLALVLFLKAFKRAFGLDAAIAPLFCLIFGSPFFLKNFVQTIGYFDIYGCVIALAMLLLPARNLLYVIAGALGCMVLILLHPVHMLLYVPTVGVIMVTRYYFVQRLTALNIGVGLAAVAAVAAVFVISVFKGAMPVPMDQLAAYLRIRAVDPSQIAPKTLDMWYRPLSEDIDRTWSVMPDNLLRLPVYLALVALHWPVIRYFRQLIRSLASAWHRRLIVAAIAGVGIGYLIICAAVFDYARWVSSWAVCMFLLLHAVKMLPASASVSPVADDKTTRTLAWIVTAIPRVGITKPF
jgi:hypothetical protein